MRQIVVIFLAIGLLVAAFFGLTACDMQPLDANGDPVALTDAGTPAPDSGAPEKNYCTRDEAPK